MNTKKAVVDEQHHQQQWPRPVEGWTRRPEGCPPTPGTPASSAPPHPAQGSDAQTLQDASATPAKAQTSLWEGTSCHLGPNVRGWAAEAQESQDLGFSSFWQHCSTCGIF